MNQEDKSANLKIVSVNMLLLLVSTCLTNLSKDGPIYDMMIIGFHVVLCIMLAIVNKSWTWFLSGLMVIIIGFSTCVMGANVHI
ncbi:MAG: hypothetical protein ABIN91_11500 [Mucilaginibacter sp.]|uniref:hypothetical protein n=1 Tax=Mucilaginibacter sp. TaxID=1882438 RepID=UPI003266A6B9